jgi:hypothetical protein
MTRSELKQVKMKNKSTKDAYQRLRACCEEPNMGVSAYDEMDLFKYLVIKTRSKLINTHFDFTYTLVPKELQLVSNSFTNLECAINEICSSDLPSPSSMNSPMESIDEVERDNTNDEISMQLVLDDI